VEEVRNLVDNLSNGPPRPKAVGVNAHHDQRAVILSGCAFLLSSNLCISFACGQRLLHEKWEPHEIVAGSTFLCAEEVSHCVKCMSRHAAIATPEKRLCAAHTLTGQAEHILVFAFTRNDFQNLSNKTVSKWL